MAYLILIRHAEPTVDPDAPSAEWRLSPAGRASCGPLAEALGRYLPAALVSSAEPKARATAEELAARWSIASRVVDGLEEQHRRNVPYMSPRAFEQGIASLFAQPEARVFGQESGAAAYARFAAAIAGLLGAHPGESLMAVTHGTVMALYLARRAGLDGLALWAQLGEPAYVVIDRADGALVETRVTLG